MKNKIIKILHITILLIITIAINSKAVSFNLSTDIKDIKTEEEIIIKIQTDKNIETTTFYLKYDNTKLQFLENLTKNTFIKDYPEDGILRVVYLDTTQQGEKELNFKFKAKTDAKDNIMLSVTNLTIQFINDSTVYTKENLEQGSFDTSVNISKKTIFTPGIRNAFIVVFILLILLIIVNIINKKEKKKRNTN